MGVWTWVVKNIQLRTTDIKIMKRAVIQLQHQLNMTLKCFHCWRINPSKTVNILFSRTNTTNISILKIDNHTIDWSNYVKYLGVTIECKLDYNKHINNMRKKRYPKSRYTLLCTQQNQPYSDKNRLDLP